MRRSIGQRVEDRARDACEYCQIARGLYDTEFQIDHIIARQHGGRTVMGNLALSCFRCNVHKGPNIAGIDPVTGRMAPLFNTRRQRWERHFRWHGSRVVGLTATGRATIVVLAMNDPGAVRIRAELAREGLFPPRK